jgi:hypothetical protein
MNREVHVRICEGRRVRLPPATRRRGERCGKGARDASGGDRKDGAQSSFSGIAADVSLLNKVASKPGCSRSARDEPGGRTADWPGGVRHVGDVSPVCCSCTERGKACPDTAVRLVAEGEREPAERLNRKAVSTVAGRAGGPARSSGEASAGRGGGGAKGPGHPWCVRLINRERASGRSRVDRLKPSGCACVRGSGGEDDRSPVTRICRAPDYAESMVGVGISPWWEAVVMVGCSAYSDGFEEGE